jgi:hypothetical protein
LSHATESKKLNFIQKKWVNIRSQIIALAFANISHSEIAAFAGQDIKTIDRWIKRAKQGEVLQDRPRSGRPLTFYELIQLKVTAFFCQFHPLAGCNSISLNWAAEYFAQHPSFLDCTISRASISRILRKHSLKPHLHKYFLQITDPDFFDIMPLIVNLYLNPPANFYSFDETPGIQAKQALAPPLPPGNGKKGIKYSEPNHHRQGTLDVYCFFDVNTGKVFSVCCDDHKVETLIKVFREHVARCPQHEVLHYLCDNLSNHSCHEFCQAVAEVCGIDYPKKTLDSKKKRQLWLQQDNKRIIFHFTPKHGSWLNIVEVWFGILGQKCLKRSSVRDTVELSELINDFATTWNTHFAHPFNWTYDGKDLYNQVVKRFIRHLMIENKFMDLTFLLSQIELLLNMLNRHFDQVSIQHWKLLENTITDKKNYISSIVICSDKPNLKKNAEEMFPELLKALKNKLHPAYRMVA